MSARKLAHSNASSAAMRQAQAVLNRITRRPAALPPEAVVKRQAKLVAFERKLIERPELSPERSADSAAAEKYVAEIIAMYGRRLEEWVCSAVGRSGLTLVPGVDASGSVLVVLDQEAAAELLHAMSKAEYPDEVARASTLATLARFGRAP